MRLPTVAATRNYDVGSVGHYATHGAPYFPPPKHVRLLAPKPAEPDPDFDTAIDRLREQEKGRQDRIPTPDDYQADAVIGHTYTDANVGMVVRLLADGLTFVEIGVKLGVGPDAVRTLVKRIRRAVAEKTPSERGQRGAAATHAKRGKA